MPKVDEVLVLRPVMGSMLATLIWTEPKSLAARMRFVHEHFLGMYRSTFTPSSLSICKQGFVRGFEVVEIEWLDQNKSIKRRTGRRGSQRLSPPSPSSIKTHLDYVRVGLYDVG